MHSILQFMLGLRGKFVALIENSIGVMAVQTLAGCCLYTRYYAQA